MFGFVLRCIQYEKTDESSSNMEDDEDENGSTLTETASNIANSIHKNAIELII